MSGEDRNARTQASGEMSQAELRAAVQVAVNNGDAYLERIRDILFGGHWQQITRQLAHLESLLQQETTQLKQETTQLKEMFLHRFDNLEAYVTTEVESLNKRLAAQRRQSDAIEQLAHEASALGDTFEQKAAALAQQTEASQHELRESLLEQSKALAQDIRDRYDDLSTRLEQQLEDLRQVKTDRGDLASLFGEMAMRLDPEGAVPEPNGAPPERHEEASQ